MSWLLAYVSIGAVLVLIYVVVDRHLARITRAREILRRQQQEHRIAERRALMAHLVQTHRTNPPTPQFVIHEEAI